MDAETGGKYGTMLAAWWREKHEMCHCMDDRLDN